MKVLEGDRSFCTEPGEEKTKTLCSKVKTAHIVPLCLWLLNESFGSTVDASVISLTHVQSFSM